MDWSDVVCNFVTSHFIGPLKGVRYRVKHGLAIGQRILAFCYIDFNWIAQRRRMLQFVTSILIGLLKGDRCRANTWISHTYMQVICYTAFDYQLKSRTSLIHLKENVGPTRNWQTNKSVHVYKIHS